MTAYEIIITIISIMSLMIYFGNFIITLLTFIEKKNKQKK